MPEPWLLPPDDRSMRFGEDLTSALLGLDALYVGERRADPTYSGSSIERLVVLDLSNSRQAAPFESCASAAESFSELVRRTFELAERDRHVYYRQTCDSALAFIAWRTRGLPFADQIAGFLHVPPAPAAQADLDALRAEMRVILTDLGYSGDLAAQFASWEERYRVPPEDVAEVLTELLSDAWDRTAAVMEIPAPKSDGMRVETVTGVPYNAMCDYARRLIRLNVEPRLTRPGLKHLAVHEGYPGHYVQFKRREAAHAAGRAPADVLLSVVNTASSTTFEGIADAGMDLIDWTSAPDDRLALLLARYRSGLATVAAWRLHAEGWPADRVRDELQTNALVGGEGWVDARLRFIAAHDRAALAWSY
jgi:hypothetical protein